MARERPQTNTLGNIELDKAEKQFEAFEDNIKGMTLDRMNCAPKLELEPQTQLSQKELAKSPDIYLKPFKTIGSREKFNEDYREQYEFDKQMVCFIAENNEIKGDRIELWTKPYAGVPAMFWHVPVNKPVWGPRYLAERIKACTYHRLKMDEKTITGQNQYGQEYGQMAVDTIINRLDARPVSQQRSVFMGTSGF